MLPRRSRLLYIAAQVVRRVAVRHQPAARADDERQVLDADRALVLAGAAGRALPEHLLACRPRRASSRARPASSASCVCRIIVFGIQLLARAPRRTIHLAAPALDAGERVEHRSCCRDPSPSRGRPAPSRNRDSAALPSSGDFRNTVIGDSTRWKCFDAGISARNARMTSVCIHQLTRAADAALVEPNVSRNVIISVAMNSAMTIDSTDTVRAERDGADERAPNQQERRCRRARPRRTASARAR